MNRPARNRQATGPAHVLVMLTTDAITAMNEHSRATWDRCAVTYATDFEQLTGPGAVPILDAAGVGRGSRLLDVGCGSGAVIATALTRGASVSAVDLSDAMAQQARRRFPACDVRVSDAIQLPFADASFDAVTFGFALHHMAQPHAALSEAHRVLRPGGAVALTVWAAPERLEAFAVGFGALAGIDLPTAPEAPPFVSYPEGAVAALVAAAFVEPFARELPLAWTVPDGRPLFSGFSAYVGLDAQPGAVRREILARLDHAVALQVGADGLAHLPNPAIVAAARRPVVPAD